MSYRTMTIFVSEDGVVFSAPKMALAKISMMLIEDNMEFNYQATMGNKYNELHTDLIMNEAKSYYNRYSLWCDSIGNDPVRLKVIKEAEDA